VSIYELRYVGENWMDSECRCEKKKNSIDSFDSNQINNRLVRIKELEKEPKFRPAMMVGP
jgi:hypothetical protein